VQRIALYAVLNADQGDETTMLRVVADALGVPLDAQ
jgi:hypothetical protein